MVRAASTSETSLNFYQTIRCHNTKDSHIQNKYKPVMGFIQQKYHNRPNSDI
jgi:hypothetical protein